MQFYNCFGAEILYNKIRSTFTFYRLYVFFTLYFISNDGTRMHMENYVINKKKLSLQLKIALDLDTVCAAQDVI